MKTELPGVLEVLLSRGIPASVLETACIAAKSEGLSPAEYLVRRAIVSTESLYCAFAEYCGVPFLPEKGFQFRTLNDVPLDLGGQKCGPTLLSLHKNKSLFAIAPQISQFDEVHAYLLKNPEFAKSIRIASPEGYHHASSISNSPAGELETRYPDYSARNIRLPAGFILALMWGIFFAVLFNLGIGPLVYVITIAGSIACFLAGAARLASAWYTRHDHLTYELPELLASGPVIWPNYTVLVPLYKEADILADLIEALDRLNYPKEKLQILLLIEQDDEETRSALPAVLPLSFEVLIVPAGWPKTKPRALGYGLAEATGDIVTVFDAEDRPDPDQLKKAALFFELGPEDLACLQARLVVDNANESFVSRHFALEYAWLFDQLLPWFHRRGWPIPLGGTSNHFKKSALHAVGGWDKYNVTEDADLGIRLERLGYRVGVLPSHTFEEAPVSINAWLAQRARWHKGWLQTILVHARSIHGLAVDLGVERTAALATLFLGTFLLIALHPIFAGVVVSYLIGLQNSPFQHADSQLLLTVFLIGGGFGYLGTIVSSWSAACRRGHHLKASDLVLFPIYWLLAGAAFYRAVWELMMRPYHWNKTRHGVSRNRNAAPADHQRLQSSG